MTQSLLFFLSLFASHSLLYLVGGPIKVTPFYEVQIIKNENAYFLCKLYAPSARLLRNG